MLAPASRQTDVLAGVSLSHRNRPIRSTTPQHPDKSAKSILQPSEPTGRVFNCSKHRSKIDNSICCFSPREGSCGLLVKASPGCPAASQRLHPPAPAAFPSAEPFRAVLLLSSSCRVALSHVPGAQGAADFSLQPRALLETCSGICRVEAPAAGHHGPVCGGSERWSWRVTAAWSVCLETSQLPVLGESWASPEPFLCLPMSQRRGWFREACCDSSELYSGFCIKPD